MKTSKPKKAKNRRCDQKYPALSPHHNLKIRYEEIEDLASYAHTLSDEDRAWLNSFSEEEICANFDHRGVKLNNSSDPAVRKRIYDKNNHRNFCIMSREKAQGTLNSLEEMDIDNERGLEYEESFE